MSAIIKARDRNRREKKRMSLMPFSPKALFLLADGDLSQEIQFF